MIIGLFFYLSMLLKTECMKKFVTLVLFLFLSFICLETNAQSNSVKTSAAQKSTQGKTKKDGTPDMRYKENKNKAKPSPKHLKKDGTPDKRYKENKK